MPQRKLVELGKIIGRVISMNQVLEIKNKGFRDDLADSGIELLRQEISGLMSAFSYSEKRNVIDDYEENSSWLNFVTV